MDSYEATLTTIKYFIGGLMGISVFFFVLIPLIRALREPMDFPELHRGLPRPKSSKTILEREIEIGVPSETKQPKDREILQIARQDPAKTASIIRRWLIKEKTP